jgi:lipopolysaccharide exporter
MGYKKDVIKGISWIGFLRFATKLVGFLEAIILAKILIPAQFGAYGIALLALGLLEVITESGVNIVLVQEKDIDKHINSAWIVSIFRGLLISVILFLSAQFISDFFRSKDALPLLQLISVVPLARGFINPAIVKFQKELMFARDFVFRFAILFIDTIVSIVVTYILQNPVGIIIGLLTGVLVELVLSFIIISPRPLLKFEMKYVSKIFHRGKWVTISTIFDYLFHNADNIVVGRLLGAASLGVYQLAYSIAAIPLIEIGRVFVHVTVPILVKISSDTERLRRAYLKTVLSIALITIPFAMVFAFFPQMFTVILGQKWAALSVVVPVLAVLGFVKSVSLSSTALFLSVNKQEYTSIITLVNILGLVISIVPLSLTYGIFGAGLSALVGSFIAVPFIIYYTHKTFIYLEKKDD